MQVKNTIEEDIHGYADEAEREYRERNYPQESDDNEQGVDTEALLPRILRGEAVEGFQTTQQLGEHSIASGNYHWLWDLAAPDDIIISEACKENNRCIATVLVSLGIHPHDLEFIAERTGMIVINYYSEDEYGNENYQGLKASLSVEVLQALSDHGLKVALLGSWRSDVKDIASAQTSLIFRCKEAGFDMDVYSYRLIPNEHGRTLPINNPISILSLAKDFRFNPFTKYWIYEGQLWADRIESENAVRPDLKVEFICRDWRWLSSERQAILLERKMRLKRRTNGTPERLDEYGRLPSIDFSKAGKYVHIKCPHGGGKTHQLITFCRDTNKRGGISIHICALRTLVTAAVKNFGAIGRDELIENGGVFSSKHLISSRLFNHVDEDGNTVGRDISLCPESMTGMSKIGMTAAKLRDVLAMPENQGKQVNLILDELPAVLSRLQTSSTIKKVGATLTAFKDLIELVHETGGKVITMSADLNDAHIKLIMQLGGYTTEDLHKPEIATIVCPSVSAPEPTRRTIHLSQCLNSTTQRFIQAVREGIEKQRTTLLLVNIKAETNAKSTLTFEGMLRRLIGRDTRILVIDADRRAVVGSNEHEFMNADALTQMEMMKDWDVIISTGCITSGVNWDAQRHSHIPDDVIHSVYAIETGRWGATNVLQAGNRVRNQDIPVEIYAPTMGCHTKHFGRNPEPETVKLMLQETANDFALMLKGIDSEIEIVDEAGEVLEPPIDPATGEPRPLTKMGKMRLKRAQAKKIRPWFDHHCSTVSLEQHELANPYIAVRTYAAMNGYRVVEIDDTHMAVSEKTETARMRKSVASFNSDVKAALLGGAISVEAADRIHGLETVLACEVNTCGGLTSEVIKQRIKELTAINKTGVLENLKGKTRREKKLQHQAMAGLTLMSRSLSLELRSLLLIRRLGRDGIKQMQPDEGNHWINTEVQQYALQLLSRDGAVNETFVEDVSTGQLEALRQKERLTPMERLRKERGECADVCCLEPDFSDAGDWSPMDWCLFARSHQPKFLFTRMLMQQDASSLQTIQKYYLRHSKDETTAARLALPAAAIKAARCLVEKQLARHIFLFEGRYLVRRADDRVTLAERALGVEPGALDLTPAEAQGIRKSNKNLWSYVVGQITSNPEQYPRHCLLTDDHHHIQDLAEDLLKNQKALTGMFDSMAVNPKGSKGHKKYCQYLSKALAEVCKGELTKVHERRTSKERVGYFVLMERPNLIPPKIGYAWVKRTWERLAYRVNTQDQIKLALDSGDF